MAVNNRELLLKKHNKTLGTHGEDKACQYLESLGYKIVERNVRFKQGEIDIIAQRSNTIYFVEVKTRSSNKFGMPYEAITPLKLMRMRKTAEIYLHSHQTNNTSNLALIEILNGVCSLTIIE